MQPTSTPATPAQKRRFPLHTRILIALVLGAIAGIVCQVVLPGGAKNGSLVWFVDTIATPVGNIFLSMIFMIVVPLLFAALCLGVSELGDVAKVGKIGIRALGMTILLSSIAVIVGLIAVNMVRPGDGISEERRSYLLSNVNREEAAKKGASEKVAEQDPPVLGVVPKNPLLEATRALTGGLMPFMFFALVFGIALSSIDPEKAQPLRSFLEGLFAVSLKVIDFAMQLAPIGVLMLVFKTSAMLGVEALVALLKYAVIVLIALAFQQFVVYSAVLKFIAKRNPAQFFRQMKTVMLTAFGTASSNATLPTALKAAENDLGLPRDISSFILTVGATANQNGTALFEGITILFLAQFSGIELTMAQQVTVMFLSIVAGIGTAGVPGGSWPMIGGIITKFGIPVESIGICLGIDRILDMSRTVLNVTGDMTIACCVAQMENRGVVIPQNELE